MLLFLIDAIVWYSQTKAYRQLD